MNEVSEDDVRLIHVTDRSVQYCRGCFTCMRNGGTCVQTDGMKEILTQIRNADSKGDGCALQISVYRRVVRDAQAEKK